MADRARPAPRARAEQLEMLGRQAVDQRRRVRQIGDDQTMAP